MLGRTLAVLGLVAAFFTSSAQAAVFQDRGPLASGTNGIVLGPDGNFWVAEQFNNSVVRMKPDGTVIKRYEGLVGPTSLTTGPGGRVWVSVTGANKLTWFDATSGAPTPHDASAGGAAGCGPVAIVAGGDGRMYFSKPDCATPALGSVADDGSGVATLVTGRGQAYDLEVVNGKVYAPDFDGAVVRRLALGTLALDATITASGASAPDGITADSAGNLWVTLYNTGHVGRFPATQNSGAMTDLAPTGGTLTEAFGIVAGNDGRIYVTGKASKNLARINADGSFQFYATTGEPWQIVNGPDSDLYFTDQASTRVVRFLSGAPRPATISVPLSSQAGASVTATVDPRGNDTQVVFEYGTTTAYGSTSAPVTIAAADGPVTASGTLAGLTAGTLYHVRVRATNEEGTATGGDTTFGTLNPPVCLTAVRLVAVAARQCGIAPTRTLAARTTFSWAFIGSRTVLRKVDIASLSGGETATVTCKGKGCPFKSKTYSKLKKGKKALGSAFGLKHKLSKGAKIEVRVTKPNTIGSSAIVTIRGRKQDPKIVRSCLKPGATKTSRC